MLVDPNGFDDEAVSWSKQLISRISPGFAFNLNQGLPGEASANLQPPGFLPKMRNVDKKHVKLVFSRQQIPYF